MHKDDRGDRSAAAQSNSQIRPASKAFNTRFMPDHRKVSHSLFSLIHSQTENTKQRRKLNKMQKQGLLVHTGGKRNITIHG